LTSGLGRGLRSILFPYKLGYTRVKNSHKRKKDKNKGEKEGEKRKSNKKSNRKKEKMIKN
jgi:hypothetical protein